MNPLWLATFAVTLFVLSATDVQFRKLPNAGIAVLMIAGLVRAMVGGVSELGLALAGAAVGFGLLFFQFSRGWMGAGDVKLLCAIGAWVGPLGAVWVFLAGSALGGLLSVIALLRLGAAERSQVTRNVALFALGRGEHLPQPSKLSHARGIPFGVALSLAAVGVAVVDGGAL